MRAQQISQENAKRLAHVKTEAEMEKERNIRLVQQEQVIMQNKQLWLDRLVAPAGSRDKNYFLTQNPAEQWYTVPERYYIIQYMKSPDGGEPNVYLYKAYNVLNQRRAFKKFRDFVG